MSRLIYVVPVHNEASILRARVQRLVDRMQTLEGSEAYLVENASSDGSWDICQELAAQAPGVKALQIPEAGIGHAYHRGLREALETWGPDARRWALLTAADLPFGFSDLACALPLLDQPPSRIFMGSKAHPASVLARGLTRRAMTLAYRLARRALVGLRVGDSQGTVFVRLDLAAQLVPAVASRGFFYSTELCYLAERCGETIVELPVVLEDESGRASTVRPWKHGSQMLKQLWQLRGRDHIG